MMKKLIATIFAAALLSVGGMGVASAHTPDVPPTTSVTHTYKCGFPLGTFKVTAPQYLIAQYDARLAAYGCTHAP
ncbi:hypothetical protein AB0I82_11515 [Streptomyces sp. NPDC050315]|uniref:hypothetical protein n=1 Tax=Streptomyces sp. NPDC050315 TaxID=3155039 RepID=UPI0034179827